MCCGFAQQIVLTFTGQDSQTNEWVQLSRIEITDVTRGWTETLVYPDTVAILTIDYTGLAENMSQNDFGLIQNKPNPFKSTTNVELNLTEMGTVALDILDVSGRIVETFQASSLQPGTHRFHINIADAGIYFLTARQNGKTFTVKMVNNGSGSANVIEYLGSRSQLLQTKNGAKGIINRCFMEDDEMTYKGYTIFNGEEIVSDIIAQPQSLSENIVLMFQLPCHGTFSDIEGNIYNMIQMGSQCWMKDNLRTKTYTDGTPITSGWGAFSDVIPYWNYPNRDEFNMDTLGLLYNWAAVMNGENPSIANPSGVQGVCPDGWHVPSNAEWVVMEAYVRSQDDCICQNDRQRVAKALADTRGWNSCSEDCTPGKDPELNNASGFSIMPAGYYALDYMQFGVSALFWSATEKNELNALARQVYYCYVHVEGGETRKYIGASVRCVRD